LPYIEDFTTLPAGTTSWPDGQVTICPICGRTGIEQLMTEEGTTVFLHSQASEMLGDGLLVEPEECCTLSRT
jgi:hypothetical protein